MQGGKSENKEAFCELRNSIYCKYKYIKDKLISIKNGELYLIGYPNEEYNEWSNSNENEFIYEDPQGVVTVIDEACNLLHQCIHCKEYKIGYEIAKILVGLKIEVGGQCWDSFWEVPYINELEYYNLGNFNYSKVIVDAMEVTYRVNNLSDRADALYKIIEKSYKNNITFELVMQGEEELPEIEEFLQLWIEYLVNKSSVRAQKLLKEALELTNSSEVLLKFSRKYYVQHPSLYEQYMINNMNKDDNLLNIGKEALRSINKKYVIRSKIALLTSSIALKNGIKDEAERCWLEAFRSNSTVINYFRLIMECDNFNNIKNEINDIYHSMYPKINKYVSNSSEELRENLINSTEFYMLTFLGGEFQYVKEHAMNKRTSLGWSSSFMKCGLAAFLLLLLDTSDLQLGCKEMCNKIISSIYFNKDEYQIGIRKTIDDSNQEWFWKCFSYWKHLIIISDDEEDKYLKWIEKLVAKRVKGIIEENYRDYYSECAAFVAAMGEVIESRGETNGKQRILLKYKSLYSRRSAFHRELRSFGMKD